MKKIDCRSFTSACCGPNIPVPLTDVERKLLEAAGTVLEWSARIDSDRASYILKSRCGHVREDNSRFACGVYDKRPDACRNFPIGSPVCQKLRRAHGIVDE